MENTSSSQDSTPQKLNENQEKFKNFVKQYNIEEILLDMLHTMSHNEIDDPLIFMIQFLSTFVPDDKLKQNNISITLPKSKKTQQPPQQQNQQQQQSNTQKPSKEISPHLMISLPPLPDNIQNIFKKIFYENAQKTFLKCKDNITELKNTCRPIIKAGLENIDKQIPIYAPDFSAYKTFQPIFHSVLLNKFFQNNETNFEKNYLNLTVNSSQKRAKQTNLNFDKISNSSSLKEEFKYIFNTKIKLRRNLQNFPFNTVQMGQDREQLAQIMLDHLKNFKINAQEFEDLSELQKHSFVLDYRVKNLFQEKKNSNLRYQQWPKNRLIGENLKHKILAVVNKDDHLLLQSFSQEKNKNFIHQICQMFKIVKQIDSKLFINFAFDSDYGYLTVKPQYLGLGFSFQCHIEVFEHQEAQFQQNISKIPKNLTQQFQLQKISNFIYKIKLIHSLTDSESTVIEKLNQYFQQLLQDLHIQQKPSNKNEDQMEIEETSSKTTTTAAANSQKKHSKNIDFSYIKNNKQTTDSECYEIYLDKIQKEFNLQKLQEKQDFHIQNIIQSLNDNSDIIVQSHDVIEKAYIVIRRNLHSIPFKPSMNLQNFKKIDSIVENFCQQLLANDENQAQWYKHNQPIYEQKSTQVLRQANIITQILNKTNSNNSSNSNSNVKADYPQGSQLYISKQKNLNIISNLQDHFTFIYQIQTHKIQHSLNQVLNTVQKFEEYLQSINEKFAQIPNFGYLTTSPKYSGSGVSCVYFIKEEMSDCLKQQEIQLENHTFVQKTHVKNEISTRYQLNNLNKSSLISFIQYCSPIINEAKKQLLDTKIIRDKEMESLTHDDKDIFSIIDCIDENYQNLKIFNPDQFQKYKKFYLHHQENQLKPQIPENQLLDLEDPQLQFPKKIFLKNAEKLPPKTPLPYLSFPSLSAPLHAKLTVELHRNFQNFPFPEFTDCESLSCLQKKIQQIILTQNLLIEGETFKKMQNLSKVPKSLLPCKLKLAKKFMDSDNIGTNQQQFYQIHLKNQKIYQLALYGLQSGLFSCYINSQQTIAIWLGLDNTHLIITAKYDIGETEQQIACINNLSNILDQIEQHKHEDKFMDYSYDGEIGYLQNLCFNDGIFLSCNITVPKSNLANFEKIALAQDFNFEIKRETMEGHCYRVKLSLPKKNFLKINYSHQIQSLQRIFTHYNEILHSSKKND